VNEANGRTIPAVRLLAEGIVIVASILLAFGIDAWWDAREVREDTRAHLNAVGIELREHLRLIEEQATLCRAQGEATATLLSMMGPDPQVASPPVSFVALMAETLSP